jgi:hypothetical protein
MLVSGVRITGTMAAVFREPVLRLGLQASHFMEAFYKALQPSQRLNLNDLLTFGGNSYGDLKLTINTFRGGGRIDITPGGLVVDLRDVPQGETGWPEVAKEHLQLCEDTLRKVLEGVEISERYLRANMWFACEGGPEAAEAFLTDRGNAALRLDQGAYATLKKEFTLQFSGLDASRATKIGLGLQRSATGDGDLFVQFEHSQIGSPSVIQTVKQQFDEADKELEGLMLHLGLETKKNDPGQS